MPKVSVIIPTYNHEAYIEKAIESVLAQSYRDFEILVCDDCSIDATLEAARRIGDPRITCHVNERNLGRVGNYCHALYRRASGEFLLMLDGDDYLTDREFLAEAVSELERDPEAALVFGDVRTYFELDGSIVEDSFNSSLPRHMPGTDLFLRFPRGHSIPHAASVVRREKAAAIGYYRENIPSADWESVLRLLIGNHVVYLGRTVATWRRHARNESSFHGLARVEENVRYIENAFSWAAEKSSLPKETLDRWRTRMLFRYFFRNYLEVRMLRPELIPALKSWMRSYNPVEYRKFRLDPRYIAVSILVHFPRLLDLLLTKVAGYGSLMKDFESQAAFGMNSHIG